MLVLGAGAVFPHCSLIESGNGLERLWRHAGESDAPPAAQGGVDALHFYAEQGLPGSRRLTAFRHTDGAVGWAAPVSSVCSPVVASEGRVFCPSNLLHAFDAASGRVLWTFEPAATLQLTEGAAGGGRVFAGAFEYERPDRSFAYGLDAATGAVLWSRRFEGRGWVKTWIRAFTLDEAAPGGPELLVSLEACYNENCYLSASVIAAVDPATGEERWRFQDGDGTDDRAIGGLTVYRGAGGGAGGLLLYSDAHSDAPFVAVDRATRRVKYRVPVQPGFLGHRRPPLVADGVAYAASGDERVYAFDVATGAVRWGVQPNRGSNRNHEVCGPYVLANNYVIAVVERATGRGRGVLLPDRETATQTAVWGERLFVATNRAAYAFDCR